MADRDQRVYVPDHEGWEARIKSDSTREYCYFKTPGEDFFHLLMVGEIYLQRGHEKCCLNCAHRQGFATPERLHWQQPGKGKRSMPK